MSFNKAYLLTALQTSKIEQVEVIHAERRNHLERLYETLASELAQNSNIQNVPSILKNVIHEFLKQPLTCMPTVAEFQALLSASQSWLPHIAIAYSIPIQDYWQKELASLLNLLSGVWERSPF